MNRYYPLLPISLFGIVLIGLHSCSSIPNSINETPTPTGGSIPTTQPSPSVSPSISKLTAKPTITQSPKATIAPKTIGKTTTGKTITVNVYTADSQCLQLVRTKVAVNAKQPMQEAIANILADIDSADFGVSSYRVSQQGNVATVELRPAIGSKRGFHSLSACEQMALFGSIQKTLTSNPQWQIKSVRFTEKGKELIL